jgi:hypothetical protein
MNPAVTAPAGSVAAIRRPPPDLTSGASDEAHEHRSPR